MLAELLGELKQLADCSPDELTDTELHEVVVEFQRAKSRLAAVEARMVAAWDARKIWAENGSKSPAARLSAECKVSKSTARCLMRRAKRLRTMPLTEAGLADGSLSVDHVDRLVAVNSPDVAHLFARDEDVLVTTARQSWYWVFHTQVGYWKQLANEEIGKPDPAAKQHNDRHFSATVGFDGCTNVIGRLDPIAGAIFREELDRLEQIIFDEDWAKPGPNTVPTPCPNICLAPRGNAAPTPSRKWPAAPPPCPPTANGPGR